jgi:4-hydroxybenzoate polyprenyltransferase
MGDLAPPPATTRRHGVLWLVGGLGLVAGFLGASFGSVVWSLGPLVLVVGVVLSRRRDRGHPLVAAGSGLALGTACYLGLGLVQPDGDGTCWGTSSGQVTCTEDG